MHGEKRKLNQFNCPSRSIFTYMKYILRNKSIITGKKNLEHLYTFKNFPVFISYVDKTDEGKDIKAEMSFGICRDSGIIQLDKVLPLDLVYQTEHSVGGGSVWKNHYLAFSKFISKYHPKNVLEIGGGNGIVAKLYTKNREGVTWTIVEPLPLCKETKKIKIIHSWFDNKFKYTKPIDAIVHSHVLEHMYDPNHFLSLVFENLKKGENHIFSIPNLYKWLQYKYTNCLNFEHTIFLTEYFVDYLLQKNGFKILKKEYYLDHSIFYATEKFKKNETISYESKYLEYKKLFRDFIEYHEKQIINFNEKIKELDCDIYLFGAHVFSQSLLEFGLNKNKLKGILDNAIIKQNKRLYGTDLFIYSPDIIKSTKSVAVILKAAAYQDEIKKQLLSLNKNVIILE